MRISIRWVLRCCAAASQQVADRFDGVFKVSKRLTAALLMLALALAACSEQRPDRSPTKLRTNVDLRVAITDPGSLDPAKADKRPGLLILKQVCDPLVAVDQATGELKPGLAESWSFNETATQVTFNIRPGIKFHNGRDLTADDFVYSLNRLADPKTKSPNYYLLERITGYKEFRNGSAPTLSGVRATGINQLQIDMPEPFAELPAVLSNVAAGSAVPKEEVEKGEELFSTVPVCTGPYRINPATKPGSVELTRFDGYHGANGAFSRGGKGYARRINFTVAPNLEDSFKLLDEGDVDVAQISNGDLIAASTVPGRVQSRPNGHVAYLGFPVTVAPFDSPDIRKSLAGTLDRGKIITKLLGGTRAEARGMLPPPVGPVAAQATCRELEAKVTRGTPVPGLTGPMNVYFNSGGGHESWLQSVVDDWSALGAQGTLKSMDWAPYLEYLTNPGADGPFRLSWAVTYPSPEALLAPLLSSGSPNNFTRFVNPEFDAQLGQARRTVNDADRAKAYADAAKLACAQMPIVPVWFGLNHVAFGEGVTAAVKQRLDVFGDPILRELSLR